MHRGHSILFALRLPQAALVFPFIISVERSRIYNGSTVVVSHATAITTILWVFLSVYTSKLRSGDGSAIPKGSKLGVLAHEATFFGLWLACTIMAGGAWNTAGTGLAGTETGLFGLSVITLLVLVRRGEMGRVNLKASDQDTPQIPVALGQPLTEDTTAEQERQPRDSIDSGFGSLQGLEEGKTLLK